MNAKEGEPGDWYGNHQPVCYVLDGWRDDREKIPNGAKELYCEVYAAHWGMHPSGKRERVQLVRELG